MNSISKTLHTLLFSSVAAWGLLSQHVTQAQNSESLLFTVGTTANTDEGDWAYLMWQSTDIYDLQDRVFDVYAKSGNAGSADSYHRISRVQLQEDPLTIAHLLQIATPITNEAEKLENTIDQLFKDFIPDGDSVYLEDKISAVLRGAILDEEKYGDLQFMARRFPAIAMSMGVAYACPLSEETTFEIRETVSGSTQVIGRITLEPGSPIILPAPAEPGTGTSTAPGGPANVSLSDGRGDLNVRLRWSVPNELRRLSLLQFGYNVWRVDAALALKNEWDVNTPTVDELKAEMNGTPAPVKKINNLPILIDSLLTPDEAHDFLFEPDTFFVQDDNGRFKPNGTPFEDGDTFYYFVSAQDILGRDGYLSAGTEVTVCRTIAPPAPTKVEVVNQDEYSPDGDPNVVGTTRKFFEISWKQNDNIPAEDSNGNGQIDDGEDLNGNGILDAAVLTTGYRIYRWDDANQYMQQEFHDADSASLAEHYVGYVDHVGGETYNKISDIHEAFSPIVSPDNPSSDAELGKTYWFTVRAVYAGACAPVLSGDSAPVYGVLRDRKGPDAPTASMLTICHNINLNWGENGVKLVERENVGLMTGVYDPNYVEFQVVCTRDEGVDWVEYSITSVPYLNQRLHFLDDEAVFNFRLYVGDGVPPYTNLTLRAGNDHGVVSNELTYALESFLKENQDRSVSMAVLAEAHASFESKESIPGGEGENCYTHYLFPPWVAGPGYLPFPRNPIRLLADVPDEAEEMRFYRRVDDSELQLIFQYLPETGELIVTHEDYTLPLTRARVCYFCQAFDKHGNSSPLAFIGCVETSNSLDLPTPQLATPDSIEVDDSTLAQLRWFCPPENVSRFKVYIGHRAATETSIADDISDELVVFDPVELTQYQDDEEVNFKSYKTGVVGSRFGFGQASASASENGGNLTITVDQPGAGYVYTPNVTLVGEDEDNYSLTVVVDTDTSSDTYGQIRSISVDNTDGYEFDHAPVVQIDAAPSSPEFGIDLKVDPDTEYFFAIQAIGPNSEEGAMSNVQTFKWTPEVEIPYNGVPWPARDLPSVQNFYSFHPKLAVEWVENIKDQRMPGIRIGEITYPDANAPGTVDELGYVPFPTNEEGSQGFIYYHRLTRESILPFMLYRYQLGDSGRWANVSDDVYQVSPLMKTILSAEISKSDSVIVDPYIGYKEIEPRETFYLYMLDTHPVLEGATYQYLLVHFSENGEIEYVLKLPAFTVPTRG